MIVNISSSLLGRSYWKEVSKQICDRQDRVFLLPIQNDNYSLIVINRLEEYYEYHKIRKMIVLVEDNKHYETIREKGDNNIVVVRCSKKNVKHLIDYYVVNNFDDRFVVASLERPTTRKVIESMIGCKGVTAEQIICRAIMHLPPKRDNE